MIYNDAIGHLQPCLFGQLHFRDHADSGYHDTNIDHCAITQLGFFDPVVRLFQAFKTHSLKHLNTMLLMKVFEVRCGLRGSNAPENTIVALNERHLQAKASGYRSHFQANISAAHHQQIFVLCKRISDTLCI